MNIVKMRPIIGWWHPLTGFWRGRATIEALSSVSDWRHQQSAGGFAA
jgi:hypothetical protein